jgi:xanthine dehydrogenase accessory factor
MKHLVFQALANAARDGERVALAIISGAKGSSPQKVGAKALFYADGRIHGTLGGGCLEAEVQQRAIQSLRTGLPATFDLLLDHDFGWDDGLICGGKVLGLILPDAIAAGQDFWAKLAARKTIITWGVEKDFFISAVETGDAPGGWQYRETISPPCDLWIAGAGHIAQAAAPLAAQLDFKVSVFDDRPALANHHYFPGEITLHAGPWEKFAALPFPTGPAFALIVTRGDHFREEKIATPEQLTRVACPVGIPIKSCSVEEIAVSILAQFIQKRAELVQDRAGSPATRSELVV